MTFTVQDPRPSLTERSETDLELGAVWTTVVWNDEVNLMSYVVYVFRSYFGFGRPRAEQLMLQVHHEGRATVATGSREEMERHVSAMHGYGLLATMEKAAR